MNCDCTGIPPINTYFGEVIKVPVKQGADNITTITETPDPHGGTILEVTTLDLSHDTVSPSSLLSGYTAHDASGNLIVGDAKSAISIKETPDPQGGTILEITGVDISHDTVSPKSLLVGYTAHDAQGNLIKGEARRGTCGFDVEVCFGEVIRVPVTDYTKLINKPTINGTVLNGDLSTGDLNLPVIYYHTTDYWDSQVDLITEAGAIYIYSDAYTKIDDQGNEVTIASIKIGDGVSTLSDIEFAAGSGTDSEAFESHVSDTVIHVDENDRSYWDNKVSMYVDPDNSERIIFTTGFVPEIEQTESSGGSTYITRTIYLDEIYDDANADYNITWQEAKEALNRGDTLYLRIPVDGVNRVYKATAAIFDFSIRKYIVRMANEANEFDKIVIFADYQTGNLYP